MPLIIWRGPTNALVMQPNSPILEYGERVLATDIYRGPQSLCAASMIPRGTFGTGFRKGWVCTRCRCEVSRGSIGTLTIEWEAGGLNAIQPLPVGSFSLDPQEQYPKIERAGMFQGISFETVNICYNAMYGADSTITTANIAARKFPTYLTDPVVAQQLALAQLLLAKLSRGEETFYLTSWRYTYEVYSYSPPSVNQGGVAAYPGGPAAASLPAGVTWLRLADKLDPAGVAGSMYKTTRVYLGGPALAGVGYWDPQVYGTAS